MYSCWYCDPSERPTFTDISKRLDYFLNYFTPSELINIDFIENSKK